MWYWQRPAVRLSHICFNKWSAYRRDTCVNMVAKELVIEPALDYRFQRLIEEVANRGMNIRTRHNITVHSYGHHSFHRYAADAQPI
ncbi:MAG: hypothetical protein LBK98_06225 [Peptococcaceae bacterium]|nr:hypothetical protein [Peptococcaceae bacterium]